MPKDDRYPQFREHMIADSMSHYQDLMNGIHEPDDLSGPVEQVRRLFREQAAIYQQAYRICGLRAMEVLAQPSDEDIEILVEGELPLALCIKHGRFRTEPKGGDTQ